MRAVTSRPTNKVSPEVRERAVRPVLDHEGDRSSRWMACQSIATKIGRSAHTLLAWVKRAGIDAGKRAGMPTQVAEKTNAPERENRELWQVNEILRKASAYSAEAPFAE
ncbi:transposase [Aureimonas ureilytica]|uniref:Transposase n=1 Tax=Aureimonas ureilytica TaxID=401562 RepID=A0A175RND7_9HYPH|nr:transposase [Aureimonas ureilytica]